MKNKKHTRLYMLKHNQFTVYSYNKLIFLKRTKWLPNERKIMFEGISMAGACRRLFKPLFKPYLFIEDYLPLFKPYHQSNL